MFDVTYYLDNEWSYGDHKKNQSINETINYLSHVIGDYYDKITTI